MAFRVSSARTCLGSGYSLRFTFNVHRFAHVIARPAQMDGDIRNPLFTSPTMALPESQEGNEGSTRYGFQDIPFFEGSMELMAVPKKKVSRHKRGIRNGPKALKPQPVIICCKVCGRVKLPHFFCCGGIRQDPEQ
ncbi:unnamed protein product [Cuscuta epithymum]|uniref:Large ribosomal subunit protein bL32m n=1 Tax=Cuscuta epithymum TaxID=186058 RepID=A0AAV0E7F7_9ASTE|nr:unnamed protein product [Cuscuta epithymum]CAH9148718.1 unnamed protein product [Cuscuta epithymum]